MSLGKLGRAHGQLALRRRLSARRRLALELLLRVRNRVRDRAAARNRVKDRVRARNRVRVRVSLACELLPPCLAPLRAARLVVTN